MATGSEEEELVQMVQDFMESGTPSPPALPAIPFHQQQTFLLLEVSFASLLARLPRRRIIDTVFWFQGILHDCTGAEVEVSERALKHVGARAGDREGDRGRLKKRLMMRLRMDGYDASLCRSSWVSTMECPGGGFSSQFLPALGLSSRRCKRESCVCFFPAGEYEYIDVVMADEGGAPTRILVDIDFRSQFELARPTIAYAQLSGILPPVFVGREEKLKKVVSLLCTAAAESLRERGLHIPPWRRSSYVHSKWFSSCHKASAIPYTSAASVQEMKLSKGGRRSGSIQRGKAGSGLSCQLSDSGINCC